MDEPPQPVVTTRVAAPLPADVVGAWYLNQESKRATLTLEADESGGPAGTVIEDGIAGEPANIEQAVYEPSGRQLTFRVRAGNLWRWYRLRLQDGIAAGRLGDGAGDAAPTDATTMTTRVTGWRAATFDKEIVPRVYDLVLDGTSRAVLRLDRAAPGSPSLVGTLKIYATAAGESDERVEEDVDITNWDGSKLAFTRPASAGHERFDGVATSRVIAGTFQTEGRAEVRAWSGERVEVLSHGLSVRSAAATMDWQDRTRARLGLLMMDGNPRPLQTTVSQGAAREPIRQTESLAARDDDDADWAQNYRLSELNFESTLPNRYGGAPLARRAHGYMSVPTTPPPSHGYPVVLAINGHWGSALQLFDPQNVYYWYGESFARRNTIVIAVDLGHRPVADRAALYGDDAQDDPANGNGNHPAIKAPGMTSDWEEDGERVWDAQRALDYVLSRPDVNRAQVTVAGLSMGAEVSDYIGALDPRVSTEIAAGSPPDLAVMSVHGNHTCWKWARGNPREYLDPADLHALMAGRTMIRETGRVDNCYSTANPPFASAKQVVRRAQPAFDALGGRLVHYLHYDEHHFHFGGRQPDGAEALGVTEPMEALPSGEALWSTSWETDSQIVTVGTSIFGFMQDNTAGGRIVGRAGPVVQ